MRIISLLALSLLFMLSGCSSLPSPTFSTRSYQEQIEMSGRLSAQYETKNGAQAIHIGFNWSQTPQQILVTLTAPTGQTLATLLINDQGAQLDQSGKPPRYANDANQLLSDTLGWPLPIAGLRDWLQGFQNAAHTPPITAQTSTTELTVEGWGLRYVSWQAENDFERPKRLDLTRQTEQAGAVALRIVVDTWNTNRNTP